MDADKLFRIELLFHGAHRPAQEVALLAHVQLHIIGAGFEPIHVIDMQELNSPGGPNHDPPQVFVRGSDLLDEGSKPFVNFIPMLARNLDSSPLHDLLEAGTIERLEEIVERLSLKGAQRILIVGSYKNHDGPL